QEEIQLRVHDRYEWVGVTQLLNYELLPADVPIAHYLPQWMCP
ncbi:MAG: 8-oxo-dGTP diphosphatase MutT, partial [Desulfitobacterium hafniense]